MTHRVNRHPDRIVDRSDIRVLVGWSHNAVPNGINLRVQSTTSVVALENDQVASQHLLMTNNQALLLARYLLAVTGQEWTEPEKPRGAWARLKAYFNR